MSSDVAPEIPSTIEIISSITSSPETAIAMGIQFVLGAALGYVMSKMIKYILAFIGIIAVGVALNIWSLGGSVDRTLKTLAIQAVEVRELLINFVAAIGILTVGPISAGFFTGLIIGSIRK
jgi:uncharacterized membrane protein (Fun14 family)